MPTYSANMAANPGTTSTSPANSYATVEYSYQPPIAAGLLTSASSSTSPTNNYNNIPLIFQPLVISAVKSDSYQTTLPLNSYGFPL